MKKLTQGFLVMMGLALLSVNAMAGGCGDCEDISVEDLAKKIADGKVTVIDVNGSKSFEKGHIPGAIDYAANKADLASKLPSDKGALIVAYCSGPQCGAHKKATKAAIALGYTNVKHLSAGISGWKEAGKKVESGS